MNVTPASAPRLAHRSAILLAALLGALGLIACLALSACGSPAQEEDSAAVVEESFSVSVSEQSEVAPVDYEPLKNEIATLVNDSESQTAVAFVDLETHEGFDINGGEQKVSASMIKMVVLSELFDQVDQGLVSLDEIYTLQHEDIVGGTGVIQDYAPGTDLSIGELATLMISQSDNTAANILINRLGPDAINEQAQESGLNQSELNRLMMDEEALRNGVENYMSANDMAALLTSIYDGEFINKDASEFALAALKGQGIDSAISSALPPEVTVAHKTGTLTQVTNDGAIVFGDHPYVLVVMTEGVDDMEAESLGRAISLAAYDFMQAKG